MTSTKDDNKDKNPFERGVMAKRHQAKVANNENRPIEPATELTQATNATETVATAAAVGGAAIDRANQSAQTQTDQQQPQMVYGQSTAQPQPAQQPTPAYPPVDAYGRPLYGQPTQAADGSKYEDVNGALGFFAVVFGFIAIVQIYVFFQGLMALAGGDSDINTIVMTVTGIAVGVSTLVALIMICLRKRIAKMLSIIALVIMLAMSLVQDILALVETLNGDNGASSLMSFAGVNLTDAQIIISGIATIIVHMIIYGLWMLYFAKSRRVRKTLTER